MKLFNFYHRSRWSKKRIEKKKPERDGEKGRERIEARWKNDSGFAEGKRENEGGVGSIFSSRTAYTVSFDYFIFFAIQFF